MNIDNNVLNNLKYRLNNWWVYINEKHKTLRILLLLGILNLAIVLIGFLLFQYLPESVDNEISDTLWQSVKILFAPATALSLKWTSASKIFIIVLVFFGMITFTGGIVGYVVNFMREKIADSINGKSDVTLNNFILFLNWNNNSLDIILDMILDRKKDLANEYIVILSNEEKGALEKEINDSINNFRRRRQDSCNKDNPKIIVRNGRSISKTDLLSINLSEVKVIYIFQPRKSTSPDNDVLKNVIALWSTFSLYKSSVSTQPNVSEVENLKRVPIVVETNSDSLRNSLKLYDFSVPGICECYLVPISREFSIAKIFAQIILRPELYDIMLELLSMSSSKICISEFKDSSIGSEILAMRNTIPLYNYSSPTYQGANHNDHMRVYITSGIEEEYAEDDVNHNTDGKSFKYQKEVYNIDDKFNDHKIIIVGINEKIYSILDTLVAHNKNFVDNKIYVEFIITKVYESKVKSIIENKKYCGSADDETGLFRYENIEDCYKIIDDYYELRTLLYNRKFRENLFNDLKSIIIFSILNDKYKVDDENIFQAWLAFYELIKNDSKYRKILKNKLILEFSDQRNSSIFENKYGDSFKILSDKFLSLLMLQGGSSGADILQILLDLVTNDQDNSINEENIGDAADLFVIQAKNFYDKNETHSYQNKKSFIYTVYKNSNGRIIPIGIIKDSTTFIFSNGIDLSANSSSKKDEKHSDLNDSYLMDGKEGGFTTGEYKVLGNSTTLNIDPEDYIIYISVNDD